MVRLNQIDKIGQAYGFVDCNGNTDQLRDFIDVAQKRLANKAPTGIRINVIKGVDPKRYGADRELHKIATQARECRRITHTIEAISTDGDNYGVASKLGNIISESEMIYSHAHGHNKGDSLYGQNGLTSSRIVYERDGKYFDVE